MSPFFASCGQSIGVSASTSVLPVNIHWFPLEWTGSISLQSKGLSRVFSNTTVHKHQLFGTQLSSQSNSHIHTWPLISHASKVMLKILQTRFGTREGRGTRDQIANIRWIIKKAKEFQKNIYFCFIDYAKAFDCVDHQKLWEILKEMGIPDLTCLLKDLYAGQEATVRTGHETTDWFQIGKGVHQGCILSPCLFDL